MNSLRRRVMFGSKEYPFVDLGLPSGLLWAQYDIGADEIGGVGHYFQWGNIVGYKYNSGYDYSQATYDYTPGSALTGSIQPDDIDHDAALAICGSPWRMPTIDNCNELINSSYTNQTWTTINGRPGWLITSKINGNTLFLPVNGCFYGGTQRDDYDTAGTFWSSTISPLSGYALRLHLNTSGFYTNNQSPRYQGFFIRPVRYPTMEYVDLGLPSGTKWATCNLGARQPTDVGLHFSWGNAEGHAEGSGYNFNQTNYNSTPGKSLTTDIPTNATYDAAVNMLGGKWRIPNKDDVAELLENTDSIYTQINGVNGWKFSKKNAGNNPPFVFVPFVGYYDGATLAEKTTVATYWLSDRYTNSDAYYIDARNDHFSAFNSGWKFAGFSIRAVYDPSL